MGVPVCDGHGFGTCASRGGVSAAQRDRASVCTGFSCRAGGVGTPGDLPEKRLGGRYDASARAYSFLMRLMAEPAANALAARSDFMMKIHAFCRRISIVRSRWRCLRRWPAAAEDILRAVFRSLRGFRRMNSSSVRRCVWRCVCCRRRSHRSRRFRRPAASRIRVISARYSGSITAHRRVVTAPAERKPSGFLKSF